MRGFRERAVENRDSLISEPFMELSRRRVPATRVCLTGVWVAVPTMFVRWDGSQAEPAPTKKRNGAEAGFFL